MSGYFFLLILCTGFFDPPAEPQSGTLRFHVYSKHDRIGEVTAVRSVSGHETSYLIRTRMSVRMLLKQDLSVEVRSVYRNGVLHGSTARSTLNGKPHGACTARLVQHQYEIRKDDDEWRIGYHIAYSGAMLYFTEPAAAQLQVFSELNGYENKLRRTGTHEYVLTDSKTKRENRYTYRNGVLEKAVIDHPLITMEFRRADD